MPSRGRMPRLRALNSCKLLRLPPGVLLPARNPPQPLLELRVRSMHCRSEKEFDSECVCNFVFGFLFGA
jgi:hypothetical protein